MWVGGVIDEGDEREINIQREERKMRVPSVCFDIVMFCFVVCCFVRFCVDFFYDCFVVCCSGDFRSLFV